MKYDLIIFDFDGTLADSYPWFAKNLNDIAKKYKFRSVRPEEQDMLRQLHAQEIVNYLKIARWKLPLVIAHMRRLMARDIGSIELFDGMADLLGNLHRSGVKLGIVSSNGLANVKTVLDTKSEIVDYFECGSRLFGKSRKIKAMLRSAKCGPERCLYLGDEVRDAEAAKAMGIDICAVTWGYNLKGALAANQPNYLAVDVSDLYKILGLES